MNPHFTNSTPLRTIPLSICMSLLSVFLVACGSDGKSDAPPTNDIVDINETMEGLTTGGDSTGGLTTGGLTTGGLTTGGLTTGGDTTGGLTTGGLTTGGLTSGGLTTGGLTTGGLTTGGLTSGGLTSGGLTTGGLTTGGLTTGGLPDNTTALSCEGTRMWGPIPGLAINLYVSEGNGTPGAEEFGCRLLWTYDPALNCSLVQTVVADATTEVTATGQLNFQNADVFSHLLPAADISIDLLNGLPDCPTDDATTDGGTTGDVIDDGGALSCDGERVWGPVETETGAMVYLSEAGGITTVECAIFWIYNPAQNCTLAVNIPDESTATVNNTGSLEFRIEGDVDVLDPAGISLQELAQIPACP